MNRTFHPLSPFLFILFAEGLNLLTKAAVDRGIYKGVEIGRDKIMIPHLQYADDTMFFGDWNNENARVGVGSGEAEELARHMGCLAGNFPFIYLGLPIGAKMKNLNDFAPVIDKFRK
ncbi:uncharacterized protein [Rutidosis leptorrhynchoides]|uniref:uncharacterized protein n=1 Tax=Rutidosis leptorrhynchoides TaxID=125765 RepID=UPI003A99E6FF